MPTAKSQSGIQEVGHQVLGILVQIVKVSVFSYPKGDFKEPFQHETPVWWAHRGWGAPWGFLHCSGQISPQQPSRWRLGHLNLVQILADQLSLSGAALHTLLSVFNKFPKYAYTTILGDVPNVWVTKFLGGKMAGCQNVSVADCRGEPNVW